MRLGAVKAIQDVNFMTDSMILSVWDLNRGAIVSLKLQGLSLTSIFHRFSMLRIGVKD